MAVIFSSRTRSPNYPSISLGEAIDAIKPVYAKERRARFPRQSLASHLGYSSLNGRSLAKIGALRAYGLIEGREDALTISSLAIAILEAPEGSQDRIKAYREAAFAPGLFRRIDEEHGGQTPSPETLKWWLTQNGYIGEAADRALRSYLDTKALILILGQDESDASSEEHAPPPTRHTYSPKPVTSSGHSFDPGMVGQETRQSERTIASGMLSRSASFRLVVTGHIGVPEIDRLLAKLALDKEILADDDTTEVVEPLSDDHDL